MGFKITWVITSPHPYGDGKEHENDSLIGGLRLERRAHNELQTRDIILLRYSGTLLEANLELP